MNKIVVTGGAGFIGSFYTKLAVRLGYNVTVIDKLTYAGDISRLSDVIDKIRFEKIDICKERTVKKILTDVQPSAIIHFAAESHVDRSIKNSSAFIKSNIIGTHTLLEISRKIPVAKFIHISTDEVYGDFLSGSAKEDDAIRPNSPYSSSKAAAELLVRSYVKTYNFPAVIVRGSNNYGPWQYPEKLIPVAINKLLNNKKVPIFGSGLQVREWIYVEDFVGAIQMVLDKALPGSIYNIGSGNEITNLDIIKMIMDYLKCPENQVQFVDDRPGHDFRYSLNCDKIETDLSWRPTTKINDGLIKTIDWYKNNQDWTKSKQEFRRK